VGDGDEAIDVKTVEIVEDLVEQARQRDPDAWEALYRRAHPRLLAFAGRRLGAEDARDAVSETMTRAVASIGRYERRNAGFEGWLFGILRNVIRDIQRRQRRRPTAPLSDEPVGGAPDPLAVALRVEEADAMRAAFARLRPADRELLELRVVAGLPAEEVAVALGRRAGAVRMAQARALERLRHLLGEDER
jgi:RNA polymerase sigma-70 factor, ECF subfamily